MEEKDPHPVHEIDCSWEGRGGGSWARRPQEISSRSVIPFLKSEANMIECDLFIVVVGL